jgi:hypothetical protein
VVRLLVQITKTEAGNDIYDPTGGSGGFLTQSHQYVEEQGQDPNDLALYGQDSNGTVWSICNMNMILHNITRFTIENGDALQAWWAVAHNDFAQLRDGKKMPEVRHELLTTLKDKLIPLKVLDEFKSAGVFVNWWQQIRYDLKKALKELIDDLQGCKGDSAHKELQNLQAQEKAIFAIEKRIKDRKVALKTKTDELEHKLQLKLKRLGGDEFKAESKELIRQVDAQLANLDNANKDDKKKIMAL